ncbi:hypothetical protein BDI24065_03002 [Burkholderia diffusa]|uniref:Uncharacterized protein n=1 Tax=Burkholderia diffusa TaxID=488732 RepID=A0A6P2L6W8_9BURK|nr:hypothetical protein BDI24065_03002 [Burkholderia diffusa]
MTLAVADSPSLYLALGMLHPILYKCTVLGAGEWVSAWAVGPTTNFL